MPNVLTVFFTFLKLGLTSFGGPIAHLAYFHKTLVEEQKWVSEPQYAQLLAICQFLPGPASSQLGFTLGLLRAGWLGALAAFIGFTLPSALLLIGFASILPYLSSDIGEAAIHGLKLVAFAVVADAVWSMSKKLCPDGYTRVIAVATIMILLLTSTAWMQLFVVFAGALLGIFFCHRQTTPSNAFIQINYGKTLGLTLLSVFFILLALAAFTVNSSVFYVIAQAFYRAGALVFGGGHVVLPLLQEAIVTTGLANNESFLAGYGASQAIPGPMFAFSAYLGTIIPATGQISWLGAGIALISIFLPGFLLVAAILPLWQSIVSNPITSNAITGINAAVVGLLAAALYDPIFTTSVINILDLAISLIGLVMLVIFRLSALWVVIWCVVARICIVLI